MCALTRLPQPDGSHPVEAAFGLFREKKKNATLIPAAETATAQKSRGRHNANVVGGFDFSQPLRRRSSARQPRSPALRAANRSQLSRSTSGRCVHGQTGRQTRRQRDREVGERQTSLPRHILFTFLSLRANGRNGHHGPDASESEKATASNQLRGRVRARVPQAAPDPSGGVQGARPDVRRAGRARARRVPQAE